MEDFNNFCDELHEKTKSIHAKSDRLVQLKMTVALTDIQLYRQVLCDFLCIFKAIEEGVQRNLEHEFIKDLWVPYLERSLLFEQDLKHYGRLGKKKLVKPSDAALEYSSHVHNVADNEPELLLAYIHTMYLAIFSGGQILKGIVRRTLGIPGPDGLKIFDVPEGMSRNGIKAHIKDTINNMDIDRQTKDRIVVEKISIFKRNNRIVASIEPKLGSYKRLLYFFILVTIFVVFCACVFVFIYKKMYSKMSK